MVMVDLVMESTGLELIAGFGEFGDEVVIGFLGSDKVKHMGAWFVNLQLPWWSCEL
jgi:hypothetical protein